MPGAVPAPAYGGAVLSQAADMPDSAAEGRETFSPGRRRYPFRTSGAPAHRGAIPFQRAGMGVPSADGLEPPTLWRFGMALHVLSPASGGAVEMKAAGVEGVAADGFQRLPLGQQGIRVHARFTPTRYFLVLLDTAGENSAGADGYEPRILGR